MKRHAPTKALRRASRALPPFPVDEHAGVPDSDRDEAQTTERTLTETDRHGGDCRCSSCTYDAWRESR